MFRIESSAVESPQVVVEYYKSNAEFTSGEGILYTEFMGEIATRQISVLDSLYYPSASLSDENDKIGFLLYDGKKSELELSDSQIISKEEFEAVWLLPMNDHKEKKVFQYVTGDAAVPLSSATIIAHIVNNKGKWGKGFVLSLSKKYPAAKKVYLDKYSNTSDLTLGDIQFISVDEKDRIFVANMVSQDGIRKNYADKKQYLSYHALEECLEKLSEFALINRLVVQMPKIGAGLGGGDWKHIESLIQKHLCYKLIKCTVVIL